MASGRRACYWAAGSLLCGSQLPAWTERNQVYSFLQQIVADAYLCVRPGVSTGSKEVNKPRFLRQEGFYSQGKQGKEPSAWVCGGAGEGNLTPGDGCGRGAVLKESGVHGEFRIH